MSEATAKPGPTHRVGAHERSEARSRRGGEQA
jgi:hypothetical protein